MANIKVGDYVMTKPFLGKVIFATVKKVEVLDDASNTFVIESPEGDEYNCYDPELITKKHAKELIKKLQINLEFLKKI